MVRDTSGTVIARLLHGYGRVMDRHRTVMEGIGQNWKELEGNWMIIDDNWTGFGLECGIWKGCDWN